MKKRILKIAAALSLLALQAATCEDTPSNLPDPVFPSEVIKKTVVAGESAWVEFNANRDWTVTIEGDGVLNYFWLEDKGGHESSVSGYAGRSGVIVTFSKENEFDTDRKCIVKLNMAGQSQTIAEIERLRVNRSFSVKVAEAFESAFRKVDGNYVYNDVPEGTTVKFVSFPEEAEYTLPVKVQTNFDWNISTPDWVVCDVTEGKAGETELEFSAVLSEAIASGSVAQIKFVDVSNNDAFEQFEITIEPFADRVEFHHTTTLGFNAEGQVMASTEYIDGGAFITVLAADGYVIRALGFNGEYHDQDFADWVHLEKMSTSGDSYLKTDLWMLTVDANTSEERVADILVLPASLASLSAADLCVSDDGGCPFKEEIQPYLLGRLTQLGAQSGPGEGQDVLMIDPDYDTYEATLNSLEDSWLKYKFDTDQFYELVYTHKEWSETQILSSIPISEAVVLDYNLAPAGSDSAFWASTWSNGNKFRVNYDLSIYQRVGAEDEELVPECFVVLVAADGSIIAVIDFKVDLQMAGGGDDNEVVSLVGDGAIEKMTSGDLYSFLKSEYSVEHVYNVNVATANPVLKLNKVVSQARTYLFDMTNGNSVPDNENITYTQDGNSFTFSILAKEITKPTTWLIVFRDVNWVNYAAVCLTYTPAEL